MMDEDFLALLTKHEGKVNTVYKDSLGYWTIGVGFLVDPRVKGAGLTDEEITAVLQIRVGKVVEELTTRLPWITSLSPNRQAVLVNMAYNMGVPNLMKFTNTLVAVQRGDYEAAAKGMLGSVWARQVDKDLNDHQGRANELADLMRAG